MVTFDQFLQDAAVKGEFVNVLFEQRVFVENADSTHSSLTRDIDLMIQREDLGKVIEAAAGCGFRFRHSAGIDMLLYGETSSACNAVQLLFAGERPLRPVRLGLHGREFWAIPIADLLAMKLGSYRDKDRVHVRGMDAAGLITPEVESALSGELQQRLRHTRETE